MNSSKISFSLNQEEGLSTLQHAAAAAGAKSESLLAKQIVMSHLSGSDGQSDLLQQVEDLSRDVVTARRQIDNLHKTLIESTRQLASHIGQSRSVQAAPAEITREDLRNTLFLLLLQQRPTNRQEAAEVVNSAIPETNPESAHHAKPKSRG